ncbi:LysE family translocator [Pelagicoccus sp. SDUM812003]|uniref:LysE family translocator n=1 Tax=Pelagicoccus sp. SDUM812003 TaxID=3041267 RepID=UPI00280DD2B9|nr:LysE family translocator [Pelagicoccus sp. SDUM812003]MDQ8203417.1 LysE family translocator [Pelagicoccus sp. SDUM812003]
MFDLSQLGAFVLATLALIAIPGPAVMFLVTRSIAQGKWIGLKSAAGVACGNYGHALLAAFGASALFVSSPVAFSILKYLGGAYLVYLGVRTWLESGKVRGEADGIDERRLRREGLRSSFAQGALVGILNPKVAVFLLAFLPQFADPDRGRLWLQLWALGSLFTLIGWLGDSCWALLGGVIGERIQSKGTGRRFAQVAAVVYVVIGVLVVL